MTAKWIAAGVVAAVVTGATVALVQSRAQQPAEKTATGCMRTGSSPTVFLLRSASIGGVEAAGSPGSPQTEDYMLVSIPDSLDLTAHINHRMSVTGVVSVAKDGPLPPAAANAAERAMPRLSVKSVKEIAANCAR